MNSPLSGPPLRLLEVSPGLWDRPSWTAGATLTELAQGVAETARRLAKGVQTSDARARLMALSRQINAWVEEVGLGFASWDVPTAELTAWQALLAALARQNAARAAARYQKPSAPPFLPMVFPPAAVLGESEAYGWISVLAHCQALREFRLEDDALAAVRGQRLARFDAARQAGLGLVEVVRFSLPGECPGGWT